MLFYSRFTFISASLMFNTTNALNSKPFKASHLDNSKNSKAFKNNEIKAVGRGNLGWVEAWLEACQPIMRPVQDC